MSNDCPARIDIFAPAEPTVTRIFPELAKEIGLNESIVLLQIAFWIKHASNCVEGEWWTFQSVRDMQEKAFGYMGLATINRTIKNLEEKKLITTGNHNKRKGDKTRWFALNPEGLSKLKSIKVVSIDSSGAVSEWNSPFQNGTPLFQDETPLDQNGTTLPETPPEITTRTSKRAKSAQGGTKTPKPKKPTLEERVAAKRDWLIALLKVDGINSMVHPEDIGVEKQKSYLKVIEAIEPTLKVAAEIPVLVAAAKKEYDRRKWSIALTASKLADFIPNYLQAKIKPVQQTNGTVQHEPDNPEMQAKITAQLSELNAKFKGA